MSAPLVSVAIATYNGELYLREQLETVYAQTWPRLEVVVSDDASTDGTRAILEDFARERGLRYAVNAERLGLVRNFERAMRMATGELIALADQDDVWMPDKVAVLVEHLGEATLVYGNCQEMIGADGRRRFAGELEPIYDFMRRHGSGRPLRFLAAENWVVSHTVLFRRELLARALPIPPNQAYHDGWLAFVAALAGDVRYVDRPLQVYREHPGSYTYRRAQADSTARIRTAREGFIRKARAETSRLAEALAHPLLSERDRRFVLRLLRYYRAGLERGHRWRSFAAGLLVARYFHTAAATGSRWKIPLRPLLAGL